MEKSIIGALRKLFADLIEFPVLNTLMPNSAKQHIYLIGPRGCGKTTVGQMLAKHLDWDWIDLDQVIQEHAGQSITEIFTNQGQTVFRDLETELLLQKSAGPPRVISLGGGAVLRPENQSVVQKTGFVVFLNAAIESLVQRIADDPASATQRPALAAPSGSVNSSATGTAGLSETAKLTDEMQQLLSLRMPVYQQTSDLQLDTTKLGPKEIVNQICRWLPLVDSRFADIASKEKS